MSIVLNCAVYTRKSAEDGLEREFNSLRAQRECCEAYIQSQKPEAWRLMSEFYDDGGYSGGNTNRPALEKLLGDVDKGNIDVVAVYKVDRLTRSLMDFSKIVERLDGKGVSFVSVTQSFNTSTSMGRLTLNVLLSFAQFEREVTVERIRDKIAASKKKGMWMGGQVPLGYEARDKQLVINEAEAETVRWLYDTYLDLGNVRRLKRLADTRGLLSKSRTSKHGRFIPGSPFRRSQLYYILKNPIYIAKIRHKKMVYEGRHVAIIGEYQWEAVQKKLSGSARKRKSVRNTSSKSWLNGLMYDDHERRFASSQTSKNGRKYRYYVTVDEECESAANGWRLPAPRIENLVLESIRDFLSKPKRVLHAVGVSNIAAEGLSAIAKDSGVPSRDISEALPNILASNIGAVVDQIRVSTNWVEIDLKPVGLMSLLDIDPVGCKVANIHTLTLPVQLKRRGVEKRLVLQNDAPSKLMGDQDLIRLVARAHCWFEDLKTGQAKTLSEIAMCENMDMSDVSRALPLAFLAPDIVADIIRGDHPVDLTSEKLQRLSSLPMNWNKQRNALGFS